MTRAAVLALADAADALARAVRALADDEANNGADLLPIAEAARIAATSTRVVKESIRSGDLPAFGRQRDRAVRRADLDAWVVARRVKPLAGPDDDEIDRRVDELARARAKRSKAGGAR